MLCVNEGCQVGMFSASSNAAHFRKKYLMPVWNSNSNSKYMHTLGCLCYLCIKPLG